MKNLDIFYIANNAEKIYRNIHWPEGPVCPECGCKYHYDCANGRYKCKDCGKIYTMKTGTVFQGSHISISYWMVALYFMLGSKGISSIELSRKLSVTQKTAWYMLYRLRAGMDQDDIFLDKEIAMDEVYIGGSYSKMTLRKKQSLIDKYNLPRRTATVKQKIALGNAVNMRYKTGVYGMNDGDKVVLQAIPGKINQQAIEDIFKKHIKNKTGMVVSDCSALYYKWKQRTGYDIETNNHSKLQFTTKSGRSSNRIEGEFSWLKRSTLNNYVHMSKPKLQLYLNEFAMRWNTRNMSMLDKLTYAINKLNHELNREVLGQFNDMEIYLYKEEDWGNPWTFFKTYGGLIQEREVNGIVYTYKEYIERFRSLYTKYINNNIFRLGLPRFSLLLYTLKNIQILLYVYKVPFKYYNILIYLTYNKNCMFFLIQDFLFFNCR